MGRRDKSRSSSNWWANREEPIPKCAHTHRHGERRSTVEQYQKFSSDEIGSPHVNLQDTLAIAATDTRAYSPPSTYFA